jgi:hypothetical protein
MEKLSLIVKHVNQANTVPSEVSIPQDLVTQATSASRVQCQPLLLLEQTLDPVQQGITALQARQTPFLVLLAPSSPPQEPKLKLHV